MKRDEQGYPNEPLPLWLWILLWVSAVSVFGIAGYTIWVLITNWEWFVR